MCWVFYLLIITMVIIKSDEGLKGEPRGCISPFFCMFFFLSQFSDTNYTVDVKHSSAGGVER